MIRIRTEINILKTGNEWRKSTKQKGGSLKDQ